MTQRTKSLRDFAGTPGSAWVPLAADEIADRVADWLTSVPGIVRVAVDGAPVAAPDEFAAGLIDRMQVRGRPVAQVTAESFWRDASLRLEHGREDAESYLSWLDAAALRREVLDAVVSSGSYLPSLRDPATNRSTREPPRSAEPELVLLVSGSLLLRHGLPFDRTIHLSVSRAARARRTSPEDLWTLPAYDEYDAEVLPAETADVIVKLDDLKHPALRWT
jgi:hypothetical protein